MPTNRSYRKRAHRAATLASRSVLAALSDPTSVETAARMLITLAEPGFEKFDQEDDGDVAKAVAVLRDELWPRYSAQCVELCIANCGAGCRPSFWWSDKPRPFVAPRNWTLPEDAARYEEARFAADVEFLKKHRCLTAAERADLQKSKKEPCE